MKDHKGGIKKSGELAAKFSQCYNVLVQPNSEIRHIFLSDFNLRINLALKIEKVEKVSITLAHIGTSIDRPVSGS